MKLYKLTDKNDQTYGGCQWGEGVTHTADGKGELCTKHWIHAYVDPVLAVFLNPMHGKYDTDTGHMWECEGEIDIDDEGRKVGCIKLTTIRRIDMPQVTTRQRTRFAILCAKKVSKNKKWIKWANGWLREKNETADDAYAAIAYAAARAAFGTVLVASPDAADYAAYTAVYAVAYAADINLVKIAHKAIREKKKK